MNEVFLDTKNVNLLWTGGWDSTFQLLRLLIIYRRRVTPYYLIDTGRRSFGIEIKTMKIIKDRLLKEYPHTQALLQPIQYFSVADISPNSEITEAYQSILKESYISSQNDWLARFCKEYGITNIQKCTQRDVYHDNTYFHIEKFLSESTNNFQTDFRIDPKFKETDAYVLYRYFSFPVIKITKIQMSDIANKHGWEKIMRMTWFCHNPIRNMKPCGMCFPCRTLIENGLGWRIPARSRMAYFFYKLFIWPLKSLAKIILNNLGLLKYIRKSTQQGFNLNQNPSME